MSKGLKGLYLYPKDIASSAGAFELTQDTQMLSLVYV